MLNFLQTFILCDKIVCLLSYMEQNSGCEKFEFYFAMSLALCVKSY